jgi:hypothetical protein
MAFPLTPPPQSDYGAFTIPRWLQRWLDVNPIGALTRTEAYITLPAFSQTVTWQGYSDIVVAFNFEGPNNFTLKGFNVEPFPLPNYCLCVMWKDQYGNTNRYSLWRGVGEIIYDNIEVYNGQKIAKNFRLEIWSTNSSPAVQSVPINIYTSVLGGVDYRFGADFVLVSSDTPCTAFGVGTLPAAACPISGLVAHWRADSGYFGGFWFDLVSSQQLTVSGSVTQTTSAAANNQSVLNIAGGNIANSAGNVINSPLTGGSQLFVILAQSAFWNGAPVFKLTDSGSATVVSINSRNVEGGYTINGQNILDNLATSYPTFRIFQIGANTAGINGFNGNVIATLQSTGLSTNSVVNLSIINSPIYIAEILFYSGFSSNAEYQQLLLYLAQRYVGSNMFALPLVFPTNSSPTQNII